MDSQKNDELVEEAELTELVNTDPDKNEALINAQETADFEISANAAFEEGDFEVVDTEELDLEDAKVVEAAGHPQDYPAGTAKEPTLHEKVAQIIKGVMLQGMKKGWHPEDLINYGVDLAQQGYKPQQIRQGILKLKSVAYYAQKKGKITITRIKRNKAKKAARKSRARNR